MQKTNNTRKIKTEMMFFFVFYNSSTVKYTRYRLTYGVKVNVRLSIVTVQQLIVRVDVAFPDQDIHQCNI